MGVHLSNDMKFSVHYAHLASKAYYQCIILLMGFHTTDIPTLLTAYKVFLRFVLESLYSNMEPTSSKSIETVLTRPYSKEQIFLTLIMALTLASKEYLIIISDLVMCFIVYGLVDLPNDNFFQTATNRHSTHGHSMKLWSIELPHCAFRRLFHRACHNSLELFARWCYFTQS